MGGVIGAILARFLTIKYDSKLSGRLGRLYKKGILVGKQQYIIVKPLTLIMSLLALHTLFFKLQTSQWIIETLLVSLGTVFIFLERPKLAIIFHILLLVYPVFIKLELPGISGAIMIIGLFIILFDISLMEDPRKYLKYGGISEIEREKIKEYMQKENQ